LAGTPAHVYGQWTLGRAQERDLLAPSIQAMRVQILQALRGSIESKSVRQDPAFDMNLLKHAYPHQELANVH
jgi:hypothetical protein